MSDALPDLQKVCARAAAHGRESRGAKPSSTFPFCSDRCKLIDLGRWLDGKYQIPAVEDDADEGSLPVSADHLAGD